MAEEYAYWSHLLAQAHANMSEADKNHRMRQKLLYLFLKDLLVGVEGKVMDGKAKRDSSDLQPVSWHAKALAWGVVVVINVGALFYVYLFALQQSQDRQAAVSVCDDACCVWTWRFSSAVLHCMLKRQ